MLLEVRTLNLFKKIISKAKSLVIQLINISFLPKKKKTNWHLLIFLMVTYRVQILHSHLLIYQKKKIITLQPKNIFPKNILKNLSTNVCFISFSFFFSFFFSVANRLHAIFKDLHKSKRNLELLGSKLFWTKTMMTSIGKATYYI